MNERLKPISYRQSILLLLLGALALRVFALNKYDLWFDEVVSNSYSSQRLNNSASRRGISPHASFLMLVKRDFQPPFYYALVYGYSIFFGNGKALRILSVVMSMMALFVFYGISKLFLDKRETIIALSLMALSPFHIWYAQEARSYATSCFFSLSAIYFFILALKTNRKFFWLGFLLLSVLSIYSSYYFFVALAASGLLFLQKEYRSRAWTWACSAAFIGALNASLIPHIIQKIQFIGRNILWLKSPSATALFFSLFIFTMGYVSQPYQRAAGLIFFWVLFLRGAYLFYRKDRANFAILFLFSLFPLTVIYFVSRVGIPLYLNRQFIFFSPFFYLFISRGIGSIKKRIVKFVVLALTGFFLMMGLWDYYRGTVYSYQDKRKDFYSGVHPRKYYVPLLESVLKDLRPQDGVVTADIQANLIVKDYFKAHSLAGERVIFLFNPVSLSYYWERWSLKLDGVSSGASVCKDSDLYELFYVDYKRTIRKVERLGERFNRVWFIVFSWDDNVVFSENAVFVRKALKRSFKKTKSLEHDGVRVELYEK